ncbi:ABC transporter permease subunit [Candidatus Phytoplasma solani]|uniref:ABC transporter permease subunit n=1 Tax=Candidatus Phytoplasma solani TaxID=69896 RepID=UPI00358FB592
MSLVVSVDAIILGFLLALLLVKIKYIDPNVFIQNKFLRFTKKTFAYLIDGYFSFFQAVPVLIQSLLFYFSISIIAKSQFKSDFFIITEGIFAVALIVIMLNTGANLAIIMLNNIKFLDQGQIQAAHALGMTQQQVFKYIIFPQSIKRTYPSIYHQFIINIKETALFSSIGLVGLVWQAQRHIATNGDTITPYLTISIIYLLLVFVANTINKLITKYGKKYAISYFAYKLLDVKKINTINKKSHFRNENDFF